MSQECRDAFYYICIIILTLQYLTLELQLTCVSVRLLDGQIKQPEYVTLGSGNLKWNIFCSHLTEDSKCSPIIR